MPQSAGCLRSPRALRHPPIDAFQQIAKLRRRDRYRPVSRRWPDEAATFQSLRKQAHTLAVMPQHLDQPAAPAAEHEQMPAVRITLELLLNEAEWLTAQVHALAKKMVAEARWQAQQMGLTRGLHRRDTLCLRASLHQRKTASTGGLRCGAVAEPDRG